MGLVFSRKDEFCKLIIARVESSTEKSYMDAVLEMCELWEIEPDACGSLLSKPIKEKVQEEASRKHFLPKVKKL